jgi:FAD/FMN-containing dehydrogenase/Fe-S oxidoreductase
VSENIREIPYNYTSYSDREIVLRFLGRQAWDDLNALREKRRTGRSARKLFEILGDVWVISRNAYLKNDLLKDRKRLAAMQALHADRLSRIETTAEDNERVMRIVEATRSMLAEFDRWFAETPARRKQARRAFAKHTHRNNVRFDAFTLTHSATDATDWRQEHPFCVLTPDSADELPGLVKASKELGMTVIPRGGGTGLCGGSVPLHADTVMINVEKLDGFGSVTERDIGGGRMVRTITAQAGAVTGKVMQASLPYVFATDPTSLWACTIGGNVASNAGGKHAVIWGTCVDNLLSWRMVTPDGNWLTVERIEHNMGRIPAEGEARFRLSRFSSDGKTPLGDAEELIVPGSVFRREGLGKDVTRKALGGLPGVQKEGVDGFITEATFVLHEPYAVTQTVCCEFYGQELTAATRAMVQIKEHVDSLSGVHLEGLEHFDEKYVKAIDYKAKSSRRERPRVVLLIDVSGDEQRDVAEACSDICRITSSGNGEGFIAMQPADRKRFWEDRGRMAAIARHTRAFKLNEDVVIPLQHLSEYNDFIEHLNIENSMANKLEALESIAALLDRVHTGIDKDDRLILEQFGVENPAYFAEKLEQCRACVREAASRWSDFLAKLDEPAGACANRLESVAHDPEEALFRVIQRGALRVSYRREVEAVLADLLRSHPVLLASIRECHKKALSRRIVIATHMHAGDGNVHTNVPVNSNDYVMMQRAHHAVEHFMAKAVELGGVISGEHGIGITKLAYMQPEYLEEMAEYKQRVDPTGLFNRDKLMPGTDLTFTYTPSFNLLEMEAVILEAADMTALSEEISPCLRCGKCKPVCNTHFPRTSMLYSPRNKIQASGAIIESFLYESQTGGGISFDQFEGLGDVADHCTICHKCEAPCPVNIDFGMVTERMRGILKDKGQARFNLGSKLSLLFLTATNPDSVKFMRRTVIGWGYAAHRWLSKAARAVGLVREIPAAKRNLDGVAAQLINFVERPLPHLPLDTARSMLGIDGRNKNEIPILRDPSRANGRAVFYFPGCGSERLFSQVGLATQAMLFELGLNVVLPPSYLCCGYPSTASGDHVRGDQITYDNRVLFHRLKHALSYLDFEAVIVSCGTCYDQLTHYELEQVFPGAPLIDIHEYLMSQGVSAEGVEGAQYIYHEPCHTPLKRHGSEAAIEALLHAPSVASAECCGEAGTLAVASPAIAGKIRARKEEEMAKAKAQLQDTQGAKVLTSCPSCLQGLSRLEGETGVAADYIVVELAKRLHGEGWQADFVNRVKNGGIERVLM